MIWILVFGYILVGSIKLVGEEVPVVPKGQVRIKIGKSQSAEGHKDAKTQAPPALSAPSNPEYEPPSESRPVSPRPIAPPPVPTTNGPCPYGKVPYTHNREILLGVWGKNSSSEVIPGFKRTHQDWESQYKTLIPDYFDRLECFPTEDRDLKRLYEDVSDGYSKRVVFCRLKLCIPSGKKVAESFQRQVRNSRLAKNSRAPGDFGHGESERPYAIKHTEGYNLSIQKESDYFACLKELREKNERVVGVIEKYSDLYSPRGNDYSNWTHIVLTLE